MHVSDFIHSFTHFRDCLQNSEIKVQLCIQWLSEENSAQEFALIQGLLADGNPNNPNASRGSQSVATAAMDLQLARAQ